MLLSLNTHKLFLFLFIAGFLTPTAKSNNKPDSTGKEIKIFWVHEFDGGLTKPDELSKLGGQLLLNYLNDLCDGLIDSQMIKIDKQSSVVDRGSKAAELYETTVELGILKALLSEHIVYHILSEYKVSNNRYIITSTINLPAIGTDGKPKFDPIKVVSHLFDYQEGRQGAKFPPDALEPLAEDIAIELYKAVNRKFIKKVLHIYPQPMENLPEGFEEMYGILPKYIMGELLVMKKGVLMEATSDITPTAYLEIILNDLSDLTGLVSIRAIIRGPDKIHLASASADFKKNEFLSKQIAFKSIIEQLSAEIKVK